MEIRSHPSLAASASDRVDFPTWDDPPIRTTLRLESTSGTIFTGSLAESVTLGMLR